jgi:outer membrane protein TolC
LGHRLAEEPAAREQAQASDADLETVRLSLHAEVAIDYFEVRSADAQKKLLDDTRVAPKPDVAEAETQLNTTRVQASDIMVRRAQYEHALAILIGKPPAEFSLPVAPLNLRSPRLPVLPVGLPAETLERRPDGCSDALFTIKRQEGAIVLSKTMRPCGSARNLIPEISAASGSLFVYFPV